MAQRSEIDEWVTYWNNCNEIQKWVITIIFWLLMNKKTKALWLLVGAAIIGPLIFAVSRDPLATIVSLTAGLVLGLLLILWWN